MKKKFKIIGVAIGLVAAAFAFRNVDFKAVLAAMIGAGWGLVWVMLNSSLWYFLYTRAWQLYFANLTHKISYLHLLKIKLCGEAVNLITPMSFMLGDPVRFYMLARHVGRASRLGSVLVDRILHVAATVLFVWVGLLLAVFFADHPLSAGIVQPVFAIYTVLLVAFIWVIADLGRGKGLVRVMAVVKRFLPKKFRDRTMAFMTEVHEDMVRFSGKNLLQLLEPFVCHVMGRFLGAVEIALLMVLFFDHLDMMQSIQLAALTSAGHLVFSFVPGGIGVIESLYAYFFLQIGQTAEAGIGLQLIRRLRAFVWILLGFLLFLASNHHDENESKIHS